MEGSPTPLPEALYNHWEKLQLVDYVGHDKFDVIDNNPIRDAFIKVLRHGIHDRGRSRHALSLKEIQPLINDFLKKQGLSERVKLTALYHHRDILLNAGLIQEVDTILEGKRYTTYYGRTAKGFILGEDSKEKRAEKKEKTITIMKSVIKELDPKLDELQIESFLDEYYSKLISIFDVLQQWISDNENVIQQSDIDIIEAMELMQNLLIAHPLIINQTNELGRLLKIPGFKG